MSEEAKHTLSEVEFYEAVLGLSVPLLQHLIIWAIGKESTLTALEETAKHQESLKAHDIKSGFKSNSTVCYHCGHLFKIFGI